MAMKLSHPNIATVRAFEEDEGGNPFLVMDYVEGEGLDEILAERGPLGEEETRRLLAPVASALDYAHAQGVVHRDVKPGNVMVRKDGTPFVLDFGIAREIQETLTRVTGKLSSGTLLYMSPEQLNGEKPRASQDVYSFAAMAYECLAGEPPFSRGQIEWQIMNKAPEPLAEGVGEALRAGILAGLAKEAKDRPATCAGVLGSAGGSQTQTARPGRLAPPAARPTNGTPRPSGRPVEKMTGEDVFVQKVRLGKELEAAGREHATAEEKAALDPIREVFTAGEEALRANRDTAAGGLFSQVQSALEAWRSALTARRARERKGEEERKPAAGDLRTVRVGSQEVALRWCPAGTFMMGSPSNEEGRYDNEVQHQVTLSQGFWMGEREVTQGLWQAVMGSNPSYFKGDNLPVEQVSWEDCQKFVKALNERHGQAGMRWALPTEAQWEYACRAGTMGPFAGTWWLDDMGWYSGNSGGFFSKKTHPVGQKQPNAWGMNDMHGNVWEWCADWFGDYPSGAVTDPTGPASGSRRVNRGGSWYDDARYCRSAYRGNSRPSDSYYDCGFRLACIPEF